MSFAVLFDYIIVRHLFMKQVITLSHAPLLDVDARHGLKEQRDSHLILHLDLGFARG